MNSSLWSVLCNIPYSLIACWTMSKLVTLRRLPLFYVFWFTGSSLLCLLSPENPALTWIRPVGASVFWMLLVLLFADGRRLRAAFGASLISVLSVAGEAIGAVAAMVLFGEYVSAELIRQRPLTMLALQVMFWMALSVLCLLLLLLWDRTVLCSDDAHLWRFVLIPASQDMLIGLTAGYAMVFRVEPWAYLLLGVLLLGSAVSDVLMFRAIRQFTAEQLSRQRAALLEEQLAEQLCHYDCEVERIESAARLRHDLRNQLQTVRILADRGEYDRAEEQLRQLNRALEGEEAVR